jgi:non-homologous end joining protein Ku
MKLPPEMVKLAQHIIRTKSGEFDPSLLEDHYRNALVRIRRNPQLITFQNSNFDHHLLVRGMMPRR